MAMARFRGRGRAGLGGEQWPGYVDALTTLLLVFIFVLTVFVLSQHVLTNALAGRDEQLAKLNQRIIDLADQLGLERQSTAALKTQLSQLQATLTATTQARDELVLKLSAQTKRAEEAEDKLKRTEESVRVERDQVKAQLAELESLRRDVAALRQLRTELEGKVGKLADELQKSSKDAGELRDRSKQLEAKLADSEERTRLAQSTLSKRETQLAELQALYLQSEDKLNAGRTQISTLEQQLGQLRQQLAALQAALNAAEAKDKESQVQIADLGKRLNLALAQRVEELAKYRSDFFQKLAEAIGNRRDVQVVGDRFVLPAELLFPSGSADLGLAGEQQLDKLVATLADITRRIPPDLRWVLRVDGHTDRIPINTDRYRSNWELSTARAIAVVKYLSEHGIPPERLAATGFAEYQPLDPRDDPAAYRRNRRIELKLTER